MKTSSFFTAGLIVSFLAASGICVSLRHSADERRAHEAASAHAAPAGPTARRERQDAAAGTARIRLGDREVFRQRLFLQISSGDAITRSRNLVEMIDSLNPADFPVFFAEMRKLCRNGDPMLLLALSAWAEVDPAAALEQELKWNPFSGDSTVIKIWVERDPMKALGWLVENDQPGSRADQALEIFAGDDPAAALAWAKNHGGKMRGDSSDQARLATVLRAMLPRHMDEVIREFSGLPAETRQGLIAPVSVRIGQLTAGERLRWLNSFPPGDGKDEAVAGIISTLGSLDERLKLLASHPGALEKPGTAELYKQWVQQDRQAALEALEQLPPGPARNRAAAAAIDGLAWHNQSRNALDLMNRYPEAVTYEGLMTWLSLATAHEHEWELALATAGRVGNQNARESFYRSVLDGWLRYRPSAARAWMDSNKELVPETVRARLEHR